MPSRNFPADHGFRGKLADPQVRHDRAVKAARARHGLDSYVKSIVDRAPELTDGQREQLSALLSPGVRQTMTRRARDAGATLAAAVRDSADAAASPQADGAA